MAWELVPNYKVINITHPLACLFFASVPNCVQSHATVSVTGCGTKGYAADTEKCCVAGQCQAAGYQCTGRAGLYQCARVSSANGSAVFPTKAECLQRCHAPPSPTPGPPPPPPKYSKPFLRFAQVIPLSNLEVDCTIVQGSTSHSFVGYRFGEFSDWVSVFKAAPATITIASGGKTLVTTSVALTFGPLVVTLRPDNVPVGHFWPPTATSIELIAASYTPGPAGSANVRLFNLSPTTRQARLLVNGKPT